MHIKINLLYDIFIKNQTFRLGFLLVPKAGLAPLRFHAESCKTVHWTIFLRTVQVPEVNKKEPNLSVWFSIGAEGGT